MAFGQSNSAGTNAGANVTTYSVAFRNAQGRTATTASVSGSGICLIVDVMWELATAGSSTITVTDSAGNTYAQFAAHTAATENWSSWVCLNAIVPTSSSTINTVTVTCSATMAQVTMAIHEYSNIAAIDTWDFESAPISSPMTCSVTTARSIETLHTFAASSFVASGVPMPSSIGPIATSAGTPTFTPREQPSAYISMTTADVSVSIAGTYTAQFGTYSHALEPAVYGAIIALVGISNPLTPGTAWLQIQEPVIGLTDRTPYLDLSGKKGKHSFTNTLRQRGTCDIPLRVKAGDATYTTAYVSSLEGCQVFLYDQNPAGSTLVFAGNIEKVKMSWPNRAGDFTVTLSCVSFEKAFDKIRVAPQAFYYKTVAEIFSSLMQTEAGGVPTPPGIVSGSFVISALVCNWDRLSDVFNQIATTASCIWGVDLTTLTSYLKPPVTTASPYVLQAKQVRFPSITWEQNNQDYRNRQLLRLSLDAFAQSAELLSTSSLPQSFALLRAAQTVTGAWLTKNTQGTAVGTFTGNPSPGETVTIGYPQTGSIYNWAPDAPYVTGQAIVDPNNNIQTANVNGTSGTSQPAWSSALGGITSETPGPSPQPGFNNGVIWTCKGPSGPGGIGASVYTFVTSLDNTQWGQVLIGPNAATTCYNLQNAINNNQQLSMADPQLVGIVYSWPTWENPVVNGDPTNGGSTITVRSKTPGGGYRASLSSSSSAFSWSGSQTTGDSTAGPGGTYVLQVAQNGSSNTANLYYTPGSNVVAIASLPTGLTSISGYHLQVQYQRAAGDCVIVENTPQVNLRAAIENGDGKYQQLASDTSNTSNTLGLQRVQAILAAYCTIPISFSFVCWKPGLATGQLLDISLASPAPANLTGLINTTGSQTWVVQEVTAELIPARPYMNQATVPGGGHYLYTVTVINGSQVDSYLAFWDAMESGEGGAL